MTLWGDVRRPGVYEVPLGHPDLRRSSRATAGARRTASGWSSPGARRALPWGRPSSTPPSTPEALREAGTALGAAAMLVVGASACPLAVAASVAAFFERENCGQCPPCAVGTASLARILRGLESGRQPVPATCSDLGDVAGFMSGHGYCAHCRAAAAVATGLDGALRRAVEAHLRAGRCPEPDRRHPDPFAPGSPEREAVEAAVAEQLR